MLPILGFFALLAYIWVIYYGFNYDTLMRTHQARLVPRVNRVSIVVSIQLIACFIAMIVMSPIYIATFLHDAYGLDSSDEYYNDQGAV